LSNIEDSSNFIVIDQLASSIEVYLTSPIPLKKKINIKLKPVPTPATNTLRHNLFYLYLVVD